MAGIKPLTIVDIPQAKKLSDAEGWNQTENDWKLLVTAPGNVCLAFVKDDKMVATATAMTYGKDLAWIGMVLVHPEYRGKGLSKLLMTVLLDKLKSCRLVQLDATPAGQPVYQKFGFKDEYLIYRMTLEAANFNIELPFSRTAAKQIDDAGINEIIKYDQQAIGASRKVLIKYLSNSYPQSTLVIKRQGIVKGFVMGRAGTRFHQVGPLVAETVEDAIQLLAAALNSIADKAIVIDVPEDKDGLIQWLKRAGFTIQRQYMRMHLNDVPSDNKTENYFLIAGPEFG